MPTRCSICATPATRAEWAGYVSELVSPEPSPTRRREYPRYPTADGSATLTFEANGKPVCISGRMLNVSEGGLMVKVSGWIRVGTPIWVEISWTHGPVIVVGFVAHTTQTVAGYKVGIQLQFAD